MNDFKIATTETYDPSLCIKSWIGHVKEYNFVLYITKVLNPDVIKLLTDSQSPMGYMNMPSVVHLTVTGWGGTFLEPNVVEPEVMKDKAAQLIAAGYPVDRIVWRVDPIVPITEGIERFERAVRLGRSLKITRFRSSVMQCYKHSYERLKETPIIEEIDAIYKGNFWPDKDMMFDIYCHIKDFTNQILSEDCNVSFEACATSQLTSIAKFKDFGCMGAVDLIVNNIDPNFTGSHGQSMQRAGCHCLLKHQLIPGGYKRGRCPNKCLYCYLKDSEKQNEQESNTLF